MTSPVVASGDGASVGSVVAAVAAAAALPDVTADQEPQPSTPQAPAAQPGSPPPAAAPDTSQPGSQPPLATEAAPAGMSQRKIRWIATAGMIAGVLGIAAVNGGVARVRRNRGL